VFEGQKLYKLKHPFQYLLQSNDAKYNNYIVSVADRDFKGFSKTKLNYDQLKLLLLRAGEKFNASLGKRDFLRYLWKEFNEELKEEPLTDSLMLNQELLLLYFYS